MQPVSPNNPDNRASKRDTVGDVRSDQDRASKNQETQRDYYSGDVIDVRCPFCRRAAQLILRNGHAKWLVEVE